MPPSVPTVPTPSAVALAPASASQGSRLSVLSAYAMAVYAIPVPFLPDRLLSRVRGAAVQDIAAQHGLSLTSDAREILAAPAIDHGSRALLRKVAEFAGRQVLRRFGPVGFAGIAVQGVELYALGYLFDRYIVEARKTGPVRIHAEEARQVRKIIDRAIRHAAAPSLQPTSITVDAGVEDLRDEFTRWIDSVLLMGASLPAYVQRRLDAAFDYVVRSNQEHEHG